MASRPPERAMAAAEEAPCAPDAAGEEASRAPHATAGEEPSRAPPDLARHATARAQEAARATEAGVQSSRARMERLSHEVLGERLERLEHDLANIQLALDNREEGRVVRQSLERVKELNARREKLMQLIVHLRRTRLSAGKDNVICDAEKMERELESSGERGRKQRKERHRKGKGKGKEVCDVEKIERVAEDYERKKGKEDEVYDSNAERYKDPLAFKYRSYKEFWNDLYAQFCGLFEDNTRIPCMRLTCKPLPYDATTFETLEVFSVKVAEISGSLQWPLDVYGLVALRDSVDNNRNVIFSRERNSCQTLTDQDPYLVLTGPMRAAVVCDPVIVEVSLHVKGTAESDDKELSLLATSFWEGTKPMASYFTLESYTSRLSTLEIGLGLIVRSVEATISSVKVISGSWPNGFVGRFIASTDSLKKEIVLLDSGAEEVPLTGDDVNLSRRVVSVEITGRLTISASASDGSVPLLGEVEFKPQEVGKSSKELRIDGLCSLEVTVAWSLFSFLPASEI